MDQPLVCCILPFHRSEYVERAIACFNAQTYPNKTLISLDTSRIPGTVGSLRNQLIEMSPMSCLMIAHFDYDDWSAPTRLAEQVAFMQQCGKPVVGYSDMPFYDVMHDKVTLYTSYDLKYVLGTSLLYRRQLWEQHPFPDKNDEEVHWLREVGADSIGRESCLRDGRPRMVATIHPRNTSPKLGSRYVPTSAELNAAVRACIAPSMVPR